MEIGRKFASNVRTYSKIIPLRLREEYIDALAKTLQKFVMANFFFPLSIVWFVEIEMQRFIDCVFVALGVSVGIVLYISTKYAVLSIFSRVCVCLHIGAPSSTFNSHLNWQNCCNFAFSRLCIWLHEWRC